MSKYKVGDKVVIRKDLVDGEYYGEWFWSYEKEYMKDKDYVVIDRVDEEGDYFVECGWCITEEMIEGLYGEVTVTNELKLFEVTYFDEDFDEHQVLKVTTDKNSAIDLVNNSMVRAFATEITEVDGYKIKLYK